MMYLKKAIKDIKKYKDNCSKKEDICKIICNIIMPEWDNIIKELNNNIQQLEQILQKIFCNIINYTKPILHKFDDYKNCNRDMVPCYNISI